MHSKALFVAAGVLAAALAAGVYVVRSHAMEARFLKAYADLIPADPELASYAHQRGAQAYQESCAACHGGQLQGDGRRGIPNLADGDWLYGTGRISEIERTLLYGIRSGNSKGWNLASMPAYANRNPYQLYQIAPLLPREIEDITAYILAFQQPPSDAAAVERGKQLFHGSERGVCWDCHGEDARGDTAIGAPDLTDAHWLIGAGTPAGIHDAIAFGLAGSCPAWINQLAPATVRALAVFVGTSQASPSNPDPGSVTQ